MNWRVKGVVQGALSSIPGGIRANDLLQRTVGGLRNFDQQVSDKVDDWVVFADHLASLGMRPQGLRFAEIGTGWFPTLPVCFALAGAKACETYDLTRHLSPRLTAKLLAALKPHLRRIAEAAKRPFEEVERDYGKMTTATSLPDVLDAARINYHAPADATKTSLPDASIDVVFSNSVLEHVPGDIIRQMLVESRRILRPGGVTVHCVNCADHYAYFDRSITPMNYFTYPEDRWRRWNNDLQYQNRLRPIDFVNMAEGAGLEVVLNCYRPREDLKAKLPGLPLAEEFRRYDAEQLTSTSVAFAGRKV